jgi:hypothetical protein
MPGEIVVDRLSLGILGSDVGLANAAFLAESRRVDRFGAPPHLGKLRSAFPRPASISRRNDRRN